MKFTDDQRLCNRNVSYKLASMNYAPLAELQSSESAVQPDYRYLCHFICMRPRAEEARMRPLFRAAGPCIFLGWN